MSPSTQAPRGTGVCRPAGALAGATMHCRGLSFGPGPRADLERDYPQLRIEALRPHSPFSHLLSGGVTPRPLAPLGVILRLAKVEGGMPWAMPRLAMFFTITLRRSE